MIKDCEWNPTGTLFTHTYPDVRITDKERSAIPLKTTAGFKHHKLNKHVQLPAFPGSINNNNIKEQKLLIAEETSNSRTIKNIAAG